LSESAASLPQPVNKDTSFSTEELRVLIAALSAKDQTHQHNEFTDKEGELKQNWIDFFKILGAQQIRKLSESASTVARFIQQNGISYNVYDADQGQSRPWSLNPLPLLIGKEEWTHISRGLAQRAKLLNEVLKDIYGQQTLLQESYLPAALVQGHPGYLRAVHQVKPPGDVYLHIVAFDIARGPEGKWWVIGNRTQAPSGLGYVLENRLIISKLFPEAFRQLRIQHIASSYRRLLDTFTELAKPLAKGETPRFALLTPGPYNETYFEHAYLARYLGLTLVEGADLTVRDQKL